MIVTMTADRIATQYGLFDQMFRLRAATFKTRIGWDVNVVDGWEKDQYDSLDPLYLMSVDARARQLLGSCRLLPTSGPHMMADVFGPHFEPDATLCSPRIWEVTRFCVRDDLKSTATPSGLNLATIELFAGVCELGRAAGITHVTGVYEPLMGRIYRRAGMRTSVIGQTATLGLPKVYAGLWELTPHMLRSLRAAGGFDGSVLAAPEPMAPAAAVA